MRPTVVVVAALAFAACSTPAGTGKAPGTGAADGAGAPAAEDAGAPPVTPVDTAPTLARDVAPLGADAAPIATPDAPAAATDTTTGAAADRAPSTDTTKGGGTVLHIVGKLPLTGSDIQIHAQLGARGLTVENVLDVMSTTAGAAGKALVIISYSVESAAVKTKFVDVPVPVMAMERNVLDALGMTAAGAHGWLMPTTQITMVPGDAQLTAGLTGEVTVYSRPGSVFWGTPAPTAIKVATLGGNASRVAMFAYPAGAMMVGRVAPGKRFHFFLGGHLVPEQYLNANGIKLLDAAIDWCVR